ncbi:hypothetical protein [Cohnella lupini]|uniref:Zinc dependent phospholipase C n=1 Tax=Cohnella lupini TaxID=1294267 RepID=A0A3D9IXC7_9BACL|nr:hypothetical protein [Cohnella lupini]RED66159.1 hypothetical protein DFP95_101657 [Cohnella lupini]
MATWVTHFRIAEEFIKRDLPISKIEFLVGNIGPDCGLIGEDGNPNPPKEITHFKIEGKIDAESFYNQYLIESTRITNSKESYYLGYYFHLVTDEEWIKLTKYKKKEKVFQNILNTPEYTSLVKRDWYGLDFLYLKKNKDSIFWTDFQSIKEFPEYMNFFPFGQTSKQIKNITEFYQNSSISGDHDFIYLTADEMDKFVENTVRVLKEKLIRKMNINIF